MNSDFLTSIAIVNVKKRNGWNEIHSEISNYNLYLKYTKISVLNMKNMVMLSVL